MKPDKTKFYVFSLVWLIFLGPTIVFIIERNGLVIVASFLWWFVGQAVLYKIYFVGVKPQYPLGVTDEDDVYFPRFDIPRPLYLDEIKRKEHEESRKLEEKHESQTTDLM